MEELKASLSNNKKVCELKDLVAQSLITKGVLGKYKAQLRASVYDVIHGMPRNEVYFENSKFKALKESQESNLLAKLIVEYLEFFDLKFSKSVLISEASLDETTDRNQVKQELDKKINLGTSKEDQPLLLQLFSNFLNNSKENVFTEATNPPKEENKKEPTSLKEHEKHQNNLINSHSLEQEEIEESSPTLDSKGELDHEPSLTPVKSLPPLKPLPKFEEELAAEKGNKEIPVDKSDEFLKSETSTERSKQEEEEEEFESKHEEKHEEEDEFNISDNFDNIGENWDNEEPVSDFSGGSFNDGLSDDFKDNLNDNFSDHSAHSNNFDYIEDIQNDDDF
ncbi:hypothetical protein ABK040_006073 [Willaertia magna]